MQWIIFFHSRGGCRYERVRDSKSVHREKKLRLKKNVTRLESETESTQEIIQTLETISEGIENYDNNYNCVINNSLFYNLFLKNPLVLKFSYIISKFLKATILLLLTRKEIFYFKGDWFINEHHQKDR
jgi:hypothetical protein